MSNEATNNSNNGGDDRTNLMAYQQDNHSGPDIFQQAVALQRLFQQQQQVVNLLQLQQQQQPPLQQQAIPQQQQLQQDTPSAEPSTQQHHQQQQGLQYQQNHIQLPNPVTDQQNMQFQVPPSTHALHPEVPRTTKVAEQLQQQQRPFNGRSNLNERECFFIFIKILMKLTTNNPRVRNRAKAIISECTRKNRLGDVDYIPLHDAVERKLKGCIGDFYWARAKLYFDAYCQRNGIQQPMYLSPVAPI